MPVFDGKIRTPSRGRLGQDGWKPPMGQLGGTSSPAEKALVHGDRELVIEGSLKSTTLKDRKLVTMQHYLCQVHGDRILQDFANLSHDTMGKEMRNVLGPSVRNYVGPVAATFIAPLTETHSSPRNINEPTTWFENVQNALKQYYVDLDASVASIQLTLSDLYLKGSAFGFTLTGYEDTKFNLKKEDAKIVINSLSYTQIVSVSLNVTALFLTSGMTASSLKLASNSYLM